MASKSSRPDLATEHEVDTGDAPEDLAGVVLSGVAWKATRRVVSTVARTGVVVVLARLLTPADYGIAGMALVVTSFALILTDPALGAALIQSSTIDERDRSTVFWLAVGIGTVLTVLGVAASGLVADFFGEPQVQNLFIATSLCLWVVSLSVAHRALLTRKLAYRSLEIREMVAIVIGGVVSIVVALAGFGPWAIVSNFIAYAVVSTVLAWVLLRWRPRAMFSRASARRLGGFSSKVFSASLLTWGNQNLDTVLVGRVLGPAPLGAYSIAYNTMQMPVTFVAGTVHQALTPAYSRIQRDRDRLERAWLRSRRTSVALVAPALALMLVLAPDVVSVLFGEQWDKAVVPLQLLCLGGLANSLSSLNWSLLQARGEGGVLVRLTILSSIVTWSAFVLGLRWGIVGVAACYAGARWLLVGPTTWITTRGAGFGFWVTLRAGAEILPFALGAGIAAFGVRELLLQTAAPPWLRLMVAGGVGAAAYMGLLLAFTPTVVRDVTEVIARQRRRRAQAEVPPAQPSPG
jgi:PST family polysaccharide transporter